MATRERIGYDIAIIAGRTSATEFSDIKRIFNQIRLLGYTVTERRTNESYMFTNIKKHVAVSDHHPGCKHVKAAYVKDFVDAMIELGFYEG